MTSIANAEIVADLASADLDYDKYLLEATSYEHNLITPVSTADVTCAAAGSNGQTITFYLEGGTYNLSRSFITLNVTAAKSATNTRAIYYYAHPGFFNRVTLTKSTGGSPLVDLQYANKYISAVGRQELSLAEVSAMDSFEPDDAIADSEGLMGTFCNYDYVGAGTNTYGRSLASVITNQLEPKYVIPASVDEAASVQAKIPLSMFFNTMLALDKAFYISERLTLQFTLDGAAAVGYIGTTATNPVWAEALGAVTLSNANLYLAMVSNQLIAKQIEKRCMEGQEVMIPNVTYTLVNYSASTSQNPDIRITRDRGKYITKLFAWNELATTPNGGYYAISNCAVGKIANTFNTTDAVVSSFVTKLNGKQVESNIMVESASRKDSYNNSKNLLVGSCIMSARSYYYNWVYRLKLKDSYNPLNEPTVPDKNHTVGGVEVGPNGEVRWQVQATTASLALNWYLFAALDKPYTIKNGIFTEPLIQ